VDQRQLTVNKEIRWFKLLPLVSVEMAWANSMGFLNRIQVQGQLAMTLNGHATIDLQHYRSGDITLDAHLNPT